MDEQLWASWAWSTCLGCVFKGASLLYMCCKIRPDMPNAIPSKWSENSFCFERVVILTLKFNFMLPDLIHNPCGAKKSLHISWNQSFLVTDTQGQTSLKTFTSKLKHWKYSLEKSVQFHWREWSVISRGYRSFAIAITIKRWVYYSIWLINQ